MHTSHQGALREALLGARVVSWSARIFRTLHASGMYFGM